MDANPAPVFSWYSGASDADIGGSGTAEEALSVCAKACSALLHWGVVTSNGGTNLPSPNGTTA